MYFGFLYVSGVTSDLRKDAEIHLPFGKSSKNPKLGTMLSLEFPSHATDILGGDGDGLRHGLLKGYNRGGIVYQWSYD